MPEPSEGSRETLVAADGWRTALLGWRAVLPIASTYVYFLIFAQFGFLKRLTELHLGDATLTPVMAAMAAGGILASLFGQRLLRGWPAPLRLRAGFVACTIAAVLSLLPLPVWSAACVAGLIGIALGVVTVTLVAHLHVWTGTRAPLTKIALGTGLGYLLCNIPWLFAGPPSRTAVVSGAGCLLAAAFVSPADNGHNRGTVPISTPPPAPFWAVLLAFTALIWLDSAAFYIIQNSPALKSGTWEGTVHLWSNAALHLFGALASAWLIRRHGLLTPLIAALLLIGSAGLLLHDPSKAVVASLFYPVGVSFYSVALVAYPSLLLAGSSIAQRERRAGKLYAVAGWIGSAMGIGMAQHLHRVPTLFIVAAALAISLAFGWRVLLANQAPAAAMLSVALLALLLERGIVFSSAPSHASAITAVERGRQVYIAEGCIHCHSQYVRPRHEEDVTMWGPGSDIETVRRQQPPLIGNRRQGPDLSEVGGRRSPLWLRMHFIRPRDVSFDSIMPSYESLFADDRGEALIAYVSSLKTPDDASHLEHMLASWTPASSIAHSDDYDGQRLFLHYCATCHAQGGLARRRWAASFRRLPPDLFAASLSALPDAMPEPQQRLQLERIIKFGLPGTDMSGHEYLPDADGVALARWLMQQRSSRVDHARKS